MTKQNVLVIKLTWRTGTLIENKPQNSIWFFREGGKKDQNKAEGKKKWEIKWFFSRLVCCKYKEKKEQNIFILVLYLIHLRVKKAYIYK